MCSSSRYRGVRCRSAWCSLFFFLMIRRPPRSTLDRSSAASDVYKRQGYQNSLMISQPGCGVVVVKLIRVGAYAVTSAGATASGGKRLSRSASAGATPGSYTHLRAHETVLVLVCRLLLAQKKKISTDTCMTFYTNTYNTIHNITRTMTPQL